MGTDHRLRWTMLRIIRLLDAAALSAVALWVAACRDSAAPTAPTAQFQTELVTCEASVPAGTLTCASSQPQTSRQLLAAPGMSFDLILGGQGALVRLASSGTAYNAGTQAFTSNVTVENLIAQPMNTTNGTTPDAGGIKVFLHSGPAVTGGTGTVTIANADGTGTFTGASQPYFLYSSGAVLASGATTSAKTWQFTVPTTVTTFAFQVFVTTRLPDETSALVALGLSRSPSALTIVQGLTGNTTVTLTRTNFTGAVTLSLGSAPAGVTGSFSPAAPTGTSSTLTVSVGAAVAPGVYNLTVDGSATVGPRSTSLTLTVSANAPGSLINGQTYSGTISVPGELDTWTFTATQGDYIALSMGTVTQTTAHFAPWIRLLSPTGVLLGNSATGTGASDIAATAPTSGTYTVIVGSLLGFGGAIDGTGSYLLTLAQGPGAVVVSTGDQGGPLTNGATNAGTIYLGDLDTWTFTATQGDYIALSMGAVAPMSAHFAPWIRLVSPTGVLLGSSATGTGASDVAATAPTSGTYTVIVGSLTGFGGAIDGTGSYLLTLAQGPGAVEVSTGDEGGPMTDGATNAGTIYLGDLDTWTFTATQGDYIALSMGAVAPMSAHFAPWIRLVSPTGVLLGSSATGTGASDVAATAPTSGTYTVIVGSLTGFGGAIDGTGSYLLTLAQGPGAVVVSAGDEGGPMTDGATNAGTIYLGDLDTWTFTATQGDYIALSMGAVAPMSAHFAPWIRLVSPTGVLLGSSATGTGASDVAATAPTSGTYTVIVGSLTGFGGAIDGTGSYLLTLAQGPGAVEVSTGDEGGPMTDGATNAGTIYLGDLDTWTFTATQGDYIALSMGAVAPMSAHFAPWIRLVSPTGVLLGSSATGQGAGNIAATAPTSGTYTVIVGSNSGATGFFDGTGSYLLTLAQGPGAVEVSAGDEGGPMTDGATNAGTIYLGDLDTWTFTATQGDYIALSMGAVAPMSAHFAPWIRLVSPTGVLLGSSATGTGASDVAATAPTSGTYTVIVGSLTGFGGAIDGTGSYLLTLAQGPGAVEVSAGDEGGPMTDGATNAGTIYLGDLDTWTFTATQGDYIALSMGAVAPMSAHFAPWIRLVSPTGVLLGSSATGTGASDVAATAPTSGTYTVIVGSLTGFGGAIDGTGSYLLTLAR